MPREAPVGSSKCTTIFVSEDIKNSKNKMEMFSKNNIAAVSGTTWYCCYISNLSNFTTSGFTQSNYLFSVNIHKIKAKKVTDLFRTGANPLTFFTC